MFTYEGEIVSSSSSDLNWLLKFIATSLAVVVVLIHLLKTAVSKSFIMFQQQHNSSSSSSSIQQPDSCVVCGKSSTKHCSACKSVKYCSTACQTRHWRSGHKTECKNFQLYGKCDTKQSTDIQNGRKGCKIVGLVPGGVRSNSIKPPKEILFPYEDFVDLYNWDKAGFPPCGLLNCGNSCFANVILQCLSCTKPLVAYLLEKSHHKECRRNDWCFLCELQTHIERASTSRQPFSPLNILSRLPNMGGNLGHGKQEDAHEFMRFAIDTMQSVCLDEFGGEKVLPPSTQETTLIQHIFGGHLQSQVICSKCCNISNQCENMMELNVEIHGDASSLEECLDQFTAREQLHGDNMYKCDGCNDYVMACKRLMVQRPPNILTIALKRFQRGRFGKLNKKVTFPETLDLSPYMIESDGNDVYKLYAVVVHVDMLNASFFGHYICYTKDFRGNWYRIDDCKVSKVDLEDILSERAYMLFYSRICPRPSCLKPIEPSSQKEPQVARGENKSDECLSTVESSHSISTPGGTDFQAEDFVRTDLFSSTSLSDDVAMTDSTSSQSSPQDMDIISNQDVKTEKEIASSLIHTNGLLPPSYEAGISDNMLMDSSAENPQCSKDSNTVKIEDNHYDVLMDSSTENSQCSKDSDVVKMEENHYDSKSLPISSASTQKMDRMDTENGFLSSSGRKLVNGTKSKPLFTPGFLQKRPSNNSIKRRRNGPSNENSSTKDAQKPNPESNGLFVPPLEK